MYVRGYLQDSENGRVVTIAIVELYDRASSKYLGNISMFYTLDRHWLHRLYEKSSSTVSRDER
jgi:hypothetical protein